MARAVPLLGAALLAASAALVAAGAGAQGRALDPCNFGDYDTPCRMRDGEYRALLPEGPGPHPAVVYLTGSLGDSRKVTEARYFREEVVRRGFALIVPTALEIPYTGGVVGTGWGRRIRAHLHPRDDLDFLRRVLHDARLRHNIDERRILWTGQSDGGFLVWEIACHHPEMGAAFAAHAASYGGLLPRRCAAPVRLLHAHGVGDDVVPFSGERALGGIVDSADLGAALALMAQTNGCDPRPAEAGRFFGFERRAWENCAEGAALELLVHPGGHDWPRTWMPAVLDWFEATSWRPPVARSVRVEGARREGFRKAGEGGGFFVSAPE